MVDCYFYNKNITDFSLYKNLLLIDSKAYDSQLFYSSTNSDTFPIIFNKIYSKTKLLKKYDPFLNQSHLSVGLEKKLNNL